MIRGSMRTTACIATAVLAPLLAPARADDRAQAVLAAMGDELSRSTTELVLQGMQRPYFIAYRVFDREIGICSATFGSVTNAFQWRTRSPEVELRVGDYAFDNTNYYPGGPSIVNGVSGGGALPLDGDPYVLRHALWLATDAAYKEALKNLSARQAVIKNKTRMEELPDFTPHPPCSVMAVEPLPPPDLQAAQRLASAISAVFRKYPGVNSSGVSVYAQSLTMYYVDNEGTRFARTEPSYTLRITAQAQRADGVPLEDFREYAAPSLAALGTEASLAAADSMGGMLAALLQAPMAERYAGPVLFEDQAAVTAFARTFLPLLCAPRIPLCANQYQRNLFGARLFLDKIGGMVLPSHVSVIDDPTLRSVDNAPAMGYFPIDDEGIPAQRKVLVDKGVLKTLLVSRSPVTGIDRSSGNRRGRLPLPGNLLVVTKKGLPAAAMKKELLRIVRKRGLEYGIIVRRIAPPSATQFPVNQSQAASGTDASAVIKNCIAVYRLYRTGEEKLVRNAEITGLSAETFRYVRALGRQSCVQTANVYAGDIFPFSGGDARLVTLAVPSLLFEDLVVKHLDADVPNPPLTPHPYFAEDGGGK